MRQKLSVLLAALLVLVCSLGLFGCGGSGSNSFTWRVEKLPANLDPQLAFTGSDVLACRHLYSGLFRLDADGVPQKDSCESYEVSADGLVYTFLLKDGLSYQGYRGATVSTPVTAADFAFGLYRVFLPETGSPYTRQFSAIRGSDAVAAGAGQDALGVVALNDSTLRITLSEPDADFLQKLTLPGAMPCNRDFFEASAGGYGLSSKMILPNGSFYLYNWTESGLFLRRRADGNFVNALRIVLNTADTGEVLGDGLQQVSEGKCDAAIYAGSETADLDEISYSTTAWALVFNCENSRLANLNLRRALAGTAYRTELSDKELLVRATGLVPPDVTLGASSYRSLAGDALPVFSSATALYRTALEELSASRISGLTVLVPDDSPALNAQFDAINQQWQAQLGIYCNVSALPRAELLSSVFSGNYAIALIPLSADENDPAALLRRFENGGICNWQNSDFSANLNDFSSRASRSGDVKTISSAEHLLLEDAAVVPLFFQTERLMINPAVKGLVFDPFGPCVDVTYATKQ